MLKITRFQTSFMRVLIQSFFCCCDVLVRTCVLSHTYISVTIANKPIDGGSGGGGLVVRGDLFIAKQTKSRASICLHHSQ